MPPTTSRKGEGEEGPPGPRTRAASRRRDTPAPSVTTRSRAARSRSPRGKTSAGCAAAEDRPEEAKRARAADGSREGGEGDTTGSRSTRGQEAASASGAGPEPADAPSSSPASFSSAVSSPLRCPRLPEVFKGRNPDGTEIYEPYFDSAVVSAYFKEKKKYRAKLKRQRKLATLDMDAPMTCLSSDKLLAVRESAMKTVFQAAKFVVGLSSSLDNKLLARCSGFFVEWDDKAKVGFILTSGHIICTKYPSIHDEEGKRQYAPKAKVHVHLVNDTTVDGELIHYDNHYHIALFKIDVNPSATIPPLCSDVKHSQDVFLLGRDENLYITCSYGRVRYENPGLFDPNHYMFVNCEAGKFGAGGLVLSFDGRFMGMANPTPRQAFIPASIILRCFRMWRKFKCIPRLHVGLQLSAIKCLQPSCIEKITSKFDIDEGFIVGEVSEGANAEKVGIRIGDIVTCLNEKKISTNIDICILLLDDLLLGICEDHLNSGNDISSTVVVTVGVFCIRNKTHCTRQLRVLVSDDIEVVKRGSITHRKAGAVGKDLILSLLEKGLHPRSHLTMRALTMSTLEIPDAPGNTEVTEN